MKTKYINFLIVTTLISAPLTSFADKIELGNSINIEINKESQNLNNKFQKIKDKGVYDNAINDLNLLLKEVEQSNIIFSEKYKLNSEINIYMNSLKNKKDNGMYNLFLNNTKILFKNGIPYIEFPKLEENLKISCTILNQDNKQLLPISNIENNISLLPKLDKETNLEIAISVLNTKTKKEELSMLMEKTFTDNEKPSLKYAYIKNGNVHIDYTDNYLLGKNPASYKLKDSNELIDIHNNTFKLEDFGELTLILTDMFNNTNEYTFNVLTDNSPIYGELPKSVLTDLLSDEFIILDTWDNLIIGEKNTSINIKQVFNDLILDFFQVKNLDNIFIVGRQDSSIELDSLGLQEIKITDNTDKILSIYTYAVDSIKNLNSNLESIESIVSDGKTLTTDSKEINIMNLLDFKFLNSNKDLSYIFVSENGSSLLKPIKNNINLMENSNNIVEIIDILSNKSISMRIIHNDKSTGTFQIDNSQAKFNNQGFVPKVPFKQYYFDVNETHWASNAIVRLTDKGVLRGYEDRYFHPDDNMTLKEFFVMFGRFLNLLDTNILNSNVKERELAFEYWGQLEANNVITRINPKTFKKLDTADFSRKIKKEEVAFIISNTLVLDEDISTPVFLKDIDSSPFKNEINILYKNGISKGRPDGSFQPSKNILRSEVAELLNNMLKE